MNVPGDGQQWGIGAAPGLANADSRYSRAHDQGQRDRADPAAAAAAALLRPGGGGDINISSSLALALAPALFSGVYSGTKAFVLNLSLSLRNELAERGIRVQAVLPGAIRTGFWGSAGASAGALPPEMVMNAGLLAGAIDEGHRAALSQLWQLAYREASTLAFANAFPRYHGRIRDRNAVCRAVAQTGRASVRIRHALTLAGPIVRPTDEDWPFPKLN